MQQILNKVFSRRQGKPVAKPLLQKEGSKR
jgi:hypothetical protein